ncbi:hypothetical protein MMA231_03900 (plasmid) [Asticcacaulis sp. MM231]
MPFMLRDRAFSLGFVVGLSLGAVLDTHHTIRVENGG